MRAIASLAVVTCLLMAQPAAARQSQASELTLERKAGCGLALVALGKGAARFPAFASMVKPDQRSTMRFMMQALGAQGLVMLDEAFAEGEARGMSPGEVYAAGVDDMLAAFEGLTPRSRNSGEAVMKRFFDRCSITPPA